jgi:RNA polymerase sigma factor (sigma-70 family)
MDQQSWLTERFEENRPRLRGVAYRMLGSLSEAEDAVQEAWLRLNRIDTATVENLGGWLTTVVSRVCLNMLRSRKLRREEPIGAQINEPLRRSREMTRLCSREVDHRCCRRGGRALVDAQEAPMQDLSAVVLSGPSGRRQAAGVLGAVVPGSAASADTGFVAAT